MNDFGPYDFHREFNLTYPMQLMGDLSRNLGRSIDLKIGLRKIGQILPQKALFVSHGVANIVADRIFGPAGTN